MKQLKRENTTLNARQSKTQPKDP
uniref:Uncharacterized protein n=1 Tax=Rhizophora mucronata TaxID=61149 RepID=A0A2P2N2B0_RHIMU